MARPLFSHLLRKKGGQLSLPEDRHVRTVIQDRWKLIWKIPDAIELYDLVEDPGETRDRSGELPDLAASSMGTS